MSGLSAATSQAIASVPKPFLISWSKALHASSRARITLLKNRRTSERLKMRVAIYARYSSEHQNERSIDDQVRLCREHAARIGAEIAGIYADYALSGSSLKNRPEAARLLTDAARRGV